MQAITTSRHVRQLELPAGRPDRRLGSETYAPHHQAWIDEFDAAVASQTAKLDAVTPVRSLAKQLTVGAYSHGLVSLAATDWLFGVLQLGSA